MCEHSAVNTRPIRGAQCGETQAALPATAQGLKRLETRMLEGGESLAALELARMDRSAVDAAGDFVCSTLFT